MGRHAKICADPGGFIREDGRFAVMRCSSILFGTIMRVRDFTLMTE